MSKLILITSLSFFICLFAAHARPTVVPPQDTIQQEMVLDQSSEENLLNTVKITIDKNSNRIYFSSPHMLTNVNITVKQLGEKVIVQQNNMTINKHYSITFPAQAGINKYTVILQKDNQIVVKRLNKDWM
ncbi:MAG: hypothetical protein AB8E82_19480 [Aureispira sp.]